MGDTDAIMMNDAAHYDNAPALNSCTPYRGSYRLRGDAVASDYFGCGRKLVSASPFALVGVVDLDAGARFPPTHMAGRTRRGYELHLSPEMAVAGNPYRVVKDTQVEDAAVYLSPAREIDDAATVREALSAVVCEFLPRTAQFCGDESVLAAANEALDILNAHYRDYRKKTPAAPSASASSDPTKSALLSAWDEQPLPAVGFIGGFDVHEAPPPAAEPPRFVCGTCLPDMAPPAAPPPAASPSAGDEPRFVCGTCGE